MEEAGYRLIADFQGDVDLGTGNFQGIFLARMDLWSGWDSKSSSTQVYE